MGCHFLLQRIFPTLGSNPGLLHCRWILYCLSHQKGHITNHPKTLRLKSTQIYYLIVFVDQKSSCELAGSFASWFCTRLQSGVGPWPQMQSQPRMYYFQAHSLVVGSPEFFAGYWPEATLGSLPRGSLPHGSLLYRSMQNGRTVHRVCQEDVSHNLF